MNKMACPFTVIAKKVVFQFPFVCMAYSGFHTAADTARSERLSYMTTSKNHPDKSTEVLQQYKCTKHALQQDMSIISRYRIQPKYTDTWSLYQNSNKSILQHGEVLKICRKSGKPCSFWSDAALDWHKSIELNAVSLKCIICTNRIKWN